jgi:hypothetical protein
MAKIPASCRAAPTAKVGRKKPASRRRPLKVPRAVVRKPWREPIQEMVDGEADGRPPEV